MAVDAGSRRGEWHFLNPGGIGTGFSWAVTGIDDARMDIRVS